MDSMHTILADVFDPRDLLYRPLLRPLPKVCPAARESLPVPSMQTGQHCVGHTLAMLIEITLRGANKKWSDYHPTATDNGPNVSADMLYQLAQRYDNELGDVGTSLRAGLKGWYHHGVALNGTWKALTDIEDDCFRRHCQERPLGAYYRVNPFRLDDVQSAICETRAVAAALYVPGKWVPPAGSKPDPSGRWQPANGEQLHLHALVLVGYNDEGFEAVNSYGPEWGNRGLGLIPYANWLEHAVDAWVARVGVPSTPLPDDRTRSGRSTMNGPAVQRAPRRSSLKAHVINVGLDGGFRGRGHYVSTEVSVRKLVSGAFESRHKHVLLWFHDSLIDDDEQRWIADDKRQMWEEHDIYPIYVAWSSRFFSTRFDDLARTIQREAPATGVLFDMRRQVDRRCELLAKDLCRAWTELNLLPEQTPAKRHLLQTIGKSIQDCISADTKENGSSTKNLHLVAAGNGCSFLFQLLPFGLEPASLTLLSPTCSAQTLRRQVESLTHRTAVYRLAADVERRAGCSRLGVQVHSHSFLTIVARSLMNCEAPPAEPPLVEDDLPLWTEASIAGLARSTGEDLGEIEVFSAPSPHSQARTPEEFSTDDVTLASITKRIRGSVSSNA